MIALAYTVPEHGTVILLSGLGLFALTALLVLNAYYKGQLDQNHDGIPDPQDFTDLIHQLELGVGNRQFIPHPSG